MPLPNDFNNLKIAMLGNYHEHNRHLPVFHQNYTTLQSRQFGQAIRVNMGNEIRRLQGSNHIKRNNVNDWSVFFDSETQLLFRNDAGTYSLAGVFRGRDRNRVLRALNLNGSWTQFLNDFNGSYEIFSHFRNVANRSKVKRVFSTQFSSCGFQLVLIGDDASAPSYLLFCHLQRATPVEQILATLDLHNDDILAIINICYPLQTSIADCFDNFSDFFDNTLRAKTVTLVRDKFFWPGEAAYSGFGMPLCGYQILPNYRLRLAMAIGYTNFMDTASVVNVNHLPKFTCTPEDRSANIDDLRNLLTAQRLRLSKQEKLNVKRKVNAVSNYYFNDLFVTGKLGGYYYIDDFIKHFTGSAKEFQTNFIRWYNRDDSANLQDYMSFQPPDEKYIMWQSAVNTGNIVDNITNFDAQDVNTLYVDLTQDVFAGNIRRGVSDLPR